MTLTYATTPIMSLFCITDMKDQPILTPQFIAVQITACLIAFPAETPAHQQDCRKPVSVKVVKALHCES